jgi:hypothetical protein
VLAIPVADAAKVRSTGGFAVELLSAGATRDEWHELQVAEHFDALLSIATPEALVAFAGAMRGQQRFRHFGEWYCSRRVDPETGKVVHEGRKSSGGSGRSKSRPTGTLRCPRCGGTNVVGLGRVAVESLRLGRGRLLPPPLEAEPLS